MPLYWKNRKLVLCWTGLLHKCTIFYIDWFLVYLMVLSAAIAEYAILLAAIAEYEGISLCVLLGVESSVIVTVDRGLLPAVGTFYCKLPSFQNTLCSSECQRMEIIQVVFLYLQNDWFKADRHDCLVQW